MLRDGRISPGPSFPKRGNEGRIYTSQNQLNLEPEKVEVLRRGRVRRAKLYYLRERFGKRGKR